ncbi:MAG TPA: diacylglycerol kinase family protein [Ktedonobacteraceae bacterium]|nr:diacylglycerol kinase family protein [Ktedonobacteraceae bacterium]
METSASSGNSGNPGSSEYAASPLVILNPTANRGHMQHYRALIRSRLEQEQGNGQYVETTRRGEAKERAYHAAKEGRPVIIVGGDGSLHEVANGILSAGRRVPLGIVAAGSGNDFAWNTLKLPHDPAEAIEHAFAGQLVDADAGIVNGEYFVNSFSVGIDADIAVAAGWMKKIPLMSGSRLYYATTVKQLLFSYSRCPWLKFSMDGDEQMDEISMRRYVLMAVTNGPTYGAGFRINPTADYSDGLFDICTISYTPLTRALKLLPVVQKGEHASLPEVTFYRAKAVHIQSKNPVNIQMDGETTSATSYDAKILPGALWVRV